jgi:prophage regulatory protein
VSIEVASAATKVKTFDELKAERKAKRAAETEEERKKRKAEAKAKRAERVAKAQAVAASGAELLRAEDVAALLRSSRSTVYRRMDKDDSSYDPTFPSPIRLGPKTLLWRRSDILAWLATKART